MLSIAACSIRQRENQEKSTRSADLDRSVATRRDGPLSGAAAAHISLLIAAVGVMGSLGSVTIVGFLVKLVGVVSVKKLVEKARLLGCLRGVMLTTMSLVGRLLNLLGIEGVPTWDMLTSSRVGSGRGSSRCRACGTGACSACSTTAESASKSRLRWVVLSAVASGTGLLGRGRREG